MGSVQRGECLWTTTTTGHREIRYISSCFHQEIKAGRGLFLRHRAPSICWRPFPTTFLRLHAAGMEDGRRKASAVEGVDGMQDKRAERQTGAQIRGGREKGGTTADPTTWGARSQGCRMAPGKQL